MDRVVVVDRDLVEITPVQAYAAPSEQVLGGDNLLDVYVFLRLGAQQYVKQLFSSTAPFAPERSG